MSVQQATPKFTGFIRRLVEDGLVSAENMQTAIMAAHKEKVDIVPYLIQNLNISPLLIAEKISNEFGEPIFDLNVYDSALIVREGIDEKLFSKYNLLPIFKRNHLLYVATSNPTNIEAMDAIRFNSKMNVEAIVVEHDKLVKLIEQNFASESAFEFEDDDFDLNFEDGNSEPEQAAEDEPQL